MFTISAIIGFISIGLVIASDCDDVLGSTSSCKNKSNQRNPMKILPGVELIYAPIDFNTTTHPSLKTVAEDSFSERISKFMCTHKLNIKLNELINKNDWKNLFGFETHSISEGRKKDKGGLGIVLMLGAMMAKMMAALGISGVGILAFKALAVSTLALVLAAIIGIKKLSDSNHSESGHHRKRRTLEDTTPLPYRGWTHYAIN